MARAQELFDRECICNIRSEALHNCKLSPAKEESCHCTSVKIDQPALNSKSNPILLNEVLFTVTPQLITLYNKSGTQRYSFSAIQR